ncbi:MAG: hypothetical protein CSA09_00550 [Candidatus Contendobacter odensis]|uniref:Type II secretion system protein K n=1 Tax=Candidatus Contendibacter odensensis TaxID=1400860 RepID=A0A2G6PFR3_9GAMM|nr:MAG: hypothetical protein CSA09_00550 [Candidatus Contendobacter odensis]
MKLPACCFYPTEQQRHDQTGVALITVLLIVFLASITATHLATLQHIAIRRSTVLQHQQQARLFTLGAEQWASLMLLRDRQQNNTDHPNEEWASPAWSLPLEEGTINLRIRDLQGCFNLNNLWQPAAGNKPDQPDPRQNPDKQQKNAVNESAQPATEQNTAPNNTDSPTDKKAHLNQAQLLFLQRLLNKLELKPELAQAIADWIDPDADTRFPDGAEDSDYSLQDPAYLAANRPFLSISELRLVKGVDQNTYNTLAPLVCALPSGTALNINTAPAPVLAALDDGLTTLKIEQILANRPEEGYKNVDELLNAAQITVEAPVKALLGTNSQYFLLRTEAQVGNGRAILYSVLFRDNNGVRILRRSFGNQD